MVGGAHPLELLLAVVAGASLGSFLNVCIDRLPRGQSILHPPSHCPACGRALGPAELAPVLSYLWLRGRCRACAAAIGLRTPLVELACALLAMAAWWSFGPDPRALWYGLLGLLALGLAVTDLEQQLLPDALVLSLAIVAALGLPLGLGPASPLEALGGAALGGGLLLAPALIRPEAFGAGDAKLAAALGLALGIQGALVALFLAVVLGGLAAAALLALGRVHRRDRFPLGPFLLLGGALALLYGPQLLHWYLQALSFS